MPKLRQFVYVSSAAQLFGRAELLAILNISRAKNATVGVTGLLLYVDGAFMQALEGQADDVAATMARIERDRRHFGITKLLDVSVAERTFGDWAMALSDLSKSEAQEALGLSDFLHTPLKDVKPGTDIARCLLENFKRANRRLLKVD